MTARFIVADVFDGLTQIADGSVDLVVTSPPFLALRSYLPADHPDKGKEIGSEATPAEFIDTMLAVTQELRRVLAPHGSICVELGDTYAGSGGAGGDYGPEGLRAGQPKFRQMPANTAHRLHDDGSIKTDAETRRAEAKNAPQVTPWTGGPGWPMPKSKCLIPELYEIALVYGLNPLTGAASPAGLWQARNIIDWCRPNPPVGALGKKWRPATSDVVVACMNDDVRYWDDLATRKPHQIEPTGEPDFTQAKRASESRPPGGDQRGYMMHHGSTHGAPLLDYWEIPPGGYPGSHYAVFPPALVEPLVKAMCPQKVCRTCGEPSRRIVETSYERLSDGQPLQDSDDWRSGRGGIEKGLSNGKTPARSISETTGWTDCGHDDYRPGIVLDPFAGSGTTLAVATGHGHDAIGIDIDDRNADLAMERVGPFLMEVV